MANVFGDDDGIFNLSDMVGGVLPEKTPEAGIFKPWHKPRKQYIRDRQWWFHIDFLLQRYNEYKDIDTIKYFGLPGGDLLDVTFFSKKLSNAENLNHKKILIHGFIDTEAEKERADIRLSALLDRPNVDQNSKIDHYNFHALSTTKSLALKRIKSQGAYHLINLDFCDGIFKQETIDSMLVLLGLQFKSMLDTPWLFFLTTRADKTGIAQQLLNNLNDIFTINISNDDDFLSTIETYRKNISTLVREKKNLTDNTISDTELSEILQACFIYWLIRLTHDNDARLEAVSVMKYKIHGGNDFPDMFSYVIRVTKKSTPTIDTLGLAKISAVKNEPLSDENKKTDKTGAVKKLYTSLNVDTLLNDNKNIFELYANEMKELLQECGWNIESYDTEMSA